MTTRRPKRWIDAGNSGFPRWRGTLVKSHRASRLGKYMGKQTEWALIGDFEQYEISTDGEVRRLDSGRILSQNVGRRGYPVVQLWKSGKNCGRAVHCLVARTFIGPVPIGAEVNHKDGNKLNPSLKNLEYVTRAGNIEHAYRLGLRRSGEHHNLAKLRGSEVAEIRKLHIPGVYGCRRMAVRFNVSPATIKNILNGSTWRHS